MTRLLALWLLVWPCALLHAQAVRLDPNYGNIASPFPGASRPLVTAPGATVTLCNNASLPCNSLATTYTDVTTGSLCPLTPIGKQVTSPGTSICTGVSDPTSGKFGWWVSPGTYYWSWFPPGGVAVQGPYAITAGSSASSTVTSVAGVAPIASTGGNTPAISISQSGTSSNGYLSSADWNTFNGKQDHLSFTLPLSIIGSTVSISQATTSTNGYLSSTDWNTFNSKQATVSASLPISISANNITISQSGTATNGYLSSADWNAFNNKQAAIAIGAQLTYLRSAPNVTTPAFQSSPLNTIEAPDYNFSGISVGSTLSAATPATITIPYAPLGVSGTNTNYYMLIAGGVGTSESVLITGGTCVSGTVGNCTLQFTPANSHSGGWSIGSASDGRQEAINIGFAAGLNVHSPGHTNTHAPISIDITHLKGQTFFGDGPAYWNQTGGTVITNLGTGPAFSLVGDLINNACEASMRLSNFTIHGSPTSGTNISASNACMLRIDHVFTDESQLYGLSCSPNCYTLVVTDSYFYASGREGVIVSDAANEVHFDRVALQGNCRLAAGISCSGLSVSAASTLAANVTVENSGFALDGNRPIGGFPSSADEAHFFGVNALTFAGNYCEQPLTHCLHIDSTTSGFDVRGNYMQQGGINIDAGATSGTITGNRLISGSQILTITNATNSGGFCRITVSAAPTIPFTVGSFESLVGISGATACNDTPTDNSAVIQSVQSTTQFTTGRPFGGAYTSGGTVEKSSGYSVGGTSGYADIHIFGNSINTSVGHVLTVGGDLLPGFGADIPSANSISPINQYHTISGTAAIQNITRPSGYEGSFCALPTAAWTTITGGNIFAAFTATPFVQKCWTYNSGNALWF